MATLSRRNRLGEILAAEGLTFTSLQQLCSRREVVSAQTMKELVNGRRRGTLRSWRRMVAALNRHPGKRQEYTLEDLLWPDDEEL